MRDNNSALIIDILRKDYPEIDSLIRQRIFEELPEKLTDFGIIPSIVKSFQEIKGTTEFNWTNLPGAHYKWRDVSKNRDLLLAIVIMFYHPEKLFQMTNNRTMYGLMGTISDELKCAKAVLKVRVSSVIVAFRAYKEFREETYSLYEQIKTENNLFQ